MVFGLKNCGDWISGDSESQTVVSHERVPANQVGICRAVATALSNDEQEAHSVRDDS